MLDKPNRSVAAKIGKVFAVIGKILGTFLLVCILTGLIFSCIFAKYVKDDLLEEAAFSMDGFALDETSVIYYTDPKTGADVELQQLYATENRTWVSYSDIPKNLRFACIAIEDKRFMDHQGVDWLRTIQASLRMFVGSGSSFGGSTLTQQLIKNLTDEREVTVRRKLVEIVRALEFEKQYSKEQILEWYFNTIYLGQGCYGVQSAAQVYFGKNVSDLSLAECASLIGITNNPSLFDPYLKEESNRKRQLTILYEMFDKGYISQTEYDAAIAQKMVFVNNSAQNEDDDENQYYSYFIDQVIRDVTADLMAKEGYSETVASQMVRKGGYAIYCTLNPAVQAQMDAVYEDVENIPKTASEQQLQSGMVIIDNKTGDVIAMTGGVGEKIGSLTLNRAAQSLLSPGSTIKPITVYGPALDQGIITPASVFDDTPYSFDGGNRWPKNTNNTYNGLMTINMAVSYSTNTIAVKVLADLTPEYSFDFAHDKLGMQGLVARKTVNGQIFSDVNLAPLALGGLTNGVTIEQMAGAYAAYANQGVFRQPRTYSKVCNKDGSIYMDNTKVPVQAVSKKAAWYMTYMLNNAVNSGTGTPAQIENMAVAGKTGTTTSDQDRWFCGYTPYYTAAVWCGYDDPEEVILTGSKTNPAGYLWQKVMAAAHEDLVSRQFDRPTALVKFYYCRDSGLLATTACRKDARGQREVEGYLYTEDVPTKACDVHVQVEMCKESGHVANEFCPQVEGNEIYKAGMLSLSRAFPMSGIYVGDQQYVLSDPDKIPKGYYPASSGVKNPAGEVCTIHTAENLPVDEPELPPEADPTLPPDPFDPTNPDASTGTGDSTNPPQDPDNPFFENPDDIGTVPND